MAHRGIAFYDVVTDGFYSVFDPTLSGGDFASRTLSSLASHEVARARDSSGSNLVLFQPVPEPSTFVFACIATFGLVALRCWRM